jgi:ribosomal protein S18 acetylase RimI-like enzyme
MQRLTQRVWSRSTGNHVGDLAWGAFLHQGRDAEWRTALWTGGDGTVRAWGWMRDGRLEQLVDPGCPELAGEVLDWYDRRATGETRSVAVLDAERAVVGAARHRGYSPEPYIRYLALDLAELPAPPALPAGWAARHLRPADPDDLARRVAVHRAAFAPSLVTEASYRTVMAAWPYRADLDWVVEAPGGGFAAFCLVWLDPAHGVGELEPVGCHPDHRRRGLARAACLGALHALKAAGGTSAVVLTLDGAGHPDAGPLYASLGFTEYARGLLYRRTAAGEEPDTDAGSRPAERAQRQRRSPWLTPTGEEWESPPDSDRDRGRRAGRSPVAGRVRHRWRAGAAGAGRRRRPAVNRISR